MDRRRLARVSTSTVGIVVALGVIWVWANRDETVHVAPALPPPETTQPHIRTESTSPSVESPIAAPAPAPAPDPIAAGSTGGRANAAGLSPWDLLAVDPSTGLPPATADYTAARAHVADLLEAIPPPWTLDDPLQDVVDEPPVGLATVEATRPFAARRVIHRGLGGLGDVWLTAADPDDPTGLGYVTAALAPLDAEDIVEEIVTPSGLRLTRLVVEGIPIWSAPPRRPLGRARLRVAER